MNISEAYEIAENLGHREIGRYELVGAVVTLTSELTSIRAIVQEMCGYAKEVRDALDGEMDDDDADEVLGEDCEGALDTFCIYAEELAKKVDA